MKIGIMQSYFFPYIGYFQLINACDKFVLYEHVSFRKKSWITRNRILDKGKGTPVYIQVPVQKQSSFKTIKEIGIVQNSDWKNKIVNLTNFNYKKAPFYNEVFEWLTKVIYLEEESLHDYNAKIIIALCKKIGIQTEIVFNNATEHIEYKLMQKKNIDNENVKSERVIELMQHFNASQFLNPIGGEALYDKSFFKSRGVGLSFLQPETLSYKQFEHQFIPHLSILDVLFHNGFKKTQHLIHKYKEL